MALHVQILSNISEQSLMSTLMNVLFIQETKVRLERREIRESWGRTDLQDFQVSISTANDVFQEHTKTNTHPFIHPFFILAFIHTWVAGVWVRGREAAYTMDRSLANHRANTQTTIHTHTHTCARFRLISSPNKQVRGTLEKQACSEKTHTCPGRACKPGAESL